MAASTVSITANPGSRRRPVLASEKRTSIGLVTSEGISPSSGRGEDRVNASDNVDLSHQSNRGEAVLEKSFRDLPQAKKSVANSTVFPRRSRKVPTKPEKSRWVTIASVFTKNLILVIALLGLAQLIRKLALKSGDGLADTDMGFSQFEGRIAELEAFLKTTTKMMQVQVEVVDRKIDNKIGGLRSEVIKKIKDQGAHLETGLKTLEARAGGFEKSLGELRATDWLSKQEFEKINEELKMAKSGEVGGGFASLGDIRAYAKEMIEKEIEKHSSDGLGRVDYALASGGAMVVRHSEPYLRGRVINWLLASARNEIHNDAVKMLKPSFGEPGQCFALKGGSGFVQIRLRTAIIPEAITLEHVAKSVAYDRSSAPRDCKVSGWLQGPDIESTVNTDISLLAEFTYDLEKSNAQTLDVLDTAGSGVVDMVRLDFTSNHGNPSHTCIYRFRVHGHEPDSASVMSMHS